ncbi:MAG TPA: hypothetical protein ENN07_06670 [candidate division Zixibacteria bacterium]|nr:hypothetical protein [candidate division Zixibacteria bacterium]
MNRKSGISLLDVIILILIVGVLAALLIPKAREGKLLEAEAECRERMTSINNAMLSFFDTFGDTTLLHAPVEPDSAEAEAKTKAEKADSAKVKVKLFTDNVDLLKPYLPDGFAFKCPLDGEEYIIHARDSLFYSISCPNGHGQVIYGRFTWEDE